MSKIKITEEKLNRLITREVLKEVNKFRGTNNHGFGSAFVNNFFSPITGWEEDDGIFDTIGKKITGKYKSKDNSDDYDRSTSRKKRDNYEDDDYINGKKKGGKAGAVGAAGVSTSGNTQKHDGRVLASFKLKYLIKEIYDGNRKFNEKYDTIKNEIASSNFKTVEAFDKELDYKIGSKYGVDNLRVVFKINKDGNTITPRTELYYLKDAVLSLCDKNNLTSIKNLYKNYFEELRYTRTTDEIKRLYYNPNAVTIVITKK